MILDGRGTIYRKDGQVKMEGKFKEGEIWKGKRYHYDKIGNLAKKHLKPNGQLFFEINQYLGQETVDLLNQKGFSNTELRKDIFGNDRMILASI